MQYTKNINLNAPNGPLRLGKELYFFCLSLLLYNSDLCIFKLRVNDMSFIPYYNVLDYFMQK